MDQRDMIYAIEERIGQPEVEEFLRVKDTARRLGMRNYYIFTWSTA